MAQHTQFRTFEDAFAWLAARTNYETMATQRYDERTYGLGRVERLLAAVGRPDREFDVAQVVGSKGKGSTATMLASILTASGRRTGLFTSPHLVDPRERIRVDGELVTDRLVCDALAALVPHVDAADARGEPLTFFEIHTVAALLVFRAARCDAAVLEAGMGGRLDATTAADAVVKVLTSVSLDHTKHLGRTQWAIAQEKAAVARHGVPFVSGVRPASKAGQVVAIACQRVDCRLLSLGPDFFVDVVRSRLDWSTGAARTSFFYVSADEEFRLIELLLELPLLGEHQSRNAALAVTAAIYGNWFGVKPTLDQIRTGLARTTLRARLEPLSTSPLVLVDGAHNPASVGILAQTVTEIAPDGPRVFVVGMSADKDVRGCLRKLAGVATLLVATTSGQTRAMPAYELAAVARSVGLRATPSPDVPAALVRARRAAGAKGTVVVTGSLYLCGEVLRLWR